MDGIIMEWNKIAQKIKNLFLKRVYAIGYRNCNGENSLIENINAEFSFIMPTLSEWYADPFVIDFNGKHYLFVEIMNDYCDNKGYIAVCDLEENNQCH